MSAFVMNITFDCADPETLAGFWAEVTGYSRTDDPAAPAGGDVVRLDAPDGRGVPHILFYRVPEPKTVKNRVHVDLATRDVEAEVGRLQELGARVLYTGAWWTTMVDPEGNEFCIG